MNGQIPPDGKDTDLYEQELADAVSEFADLQAIEESVDIESFCSRYPRLHRDLKPQLETLQGIQDTLEPSEVFDSEPSPELPERLSGHRIIGELGSGGMGRVLLAIDDRLGRKLAIKTLLPRFRDQETIRKRFMQEARSMAQLSHPNVVRIYNLGRPDEEPHFVMEYLEGKPLTEAAKPLTVAQKAELMHKVLLAADFLHHNGVIHRDLKPGNIVVGPDLEPKVLDFGLAVPGIRQSGQITRDGEVIGTPDYFSPEQARGQHPLDVRSDLFSLGILFYELLTGSLPFKGSTLAEQIHNICELDPALPRRLNRSIPGDLQKICLKALEKNPDDRYTSAAEMASDINRFLAGEPVLAAPSTYSRLITGKIEQHLLELNAWREDQILTDMEFDSFRRLYDRLVDKDDSWIMEMRRFSRSQVVLYLGAWILVVGAALLMLFLYPSLSGTPVVLLVAAAAVPAAGLGVRNWKGGRPGTAVAYLLAFCLLLPATLVVAMNEWGFFTQFTRGDPDLEFFSLFQSFKLITNQQLWWAILLSLPAYLWLRKFTEASVFTLVLSVMLAQLCGVTLLRMGMLEWLEDDPGRPFFYLIPCALVFFSIGITLERSKQTLDSRYFYPIAVFFALTALSGVALFHEPYAEWLQRSFPITRGQIDYLFILNASIYLALQYLSDFLNTPQTRWVAKSFRFVIPGHILTPILLLGLSASERWEESLQDSGLRFEARFFEVLLPIAACAFVFGSIPKQMKNFLAWGLLFLGIGLVRLQQDLFWDEVWWPITLLITGLCLMGLAANNPRVLRFLRK